MVDFLCLLRDLEWGEYIDGVGGVRGFVFGVEYEIYDIIGNLCIVNNYDVLCVVCFFWNKFVVKMFLGNLEFFKRKN